MRSTKIAIANHPCLRTELQRRSAEGQLAPAPIADTSTLRSNSDPSKAPKPPPQIGETRLLDRPIFDLLSKSQASQVLPSPEFDS